MNLSNTSAKSNKMASVASGRLLGQDLVLACLMIWELILCFITLEQTDVIDTGLKKRG